MKIKNVEEFKNLNKLYSKQNNCKQKMVAVCSGTGCRAGKAINVFEAFKSELMNYKEDIILKETGCHGFCEKGPLVVIRPDNIFYQQVNPEIVPEIVEKTILKGEIIDSLLFKNPENAEKIIEENEIPFYKGQERFIFGSNGYIDPKSIDDYIKIGGYSSLVKALSEMTQEKIVDEIIESGLRGRGGGGYPTGIKWKSCQKAEGNRKFIICNADEGDPGAYMDRSILEGNPHSVLEGMIIGAYAIGSCEGYIYVRAEYPLAVENISIAIESARKYGLLGKNILGTGFSFDIRITKGGGAFVCGESTALMLSLEGKIGEPRFKHTHTAESGLYNLPTNLNNVETWANIPLIINKGSKWYRKIGTKGSKGTKLFSLVGKVMNTGLVEVPMGVTLRKIIFDIGGGIPDGKKFKAVQTGGPSGGCIPEEKLDMQVDFDELTKIGSMMGSGGMIVMDENTCMVNIAKYFLSFLVEESCGKCTPCREGIYQLYKIVNQITEGKGKADDINKLEELSEMIKDCSLCALGKTAPNPVMSTIRYFRNEYEKHILDKKCPAGVCKSLIEFKIDVKKCTKCGLCYKRCPSNSVIWEKKQIAEIISDKCTKCGICYNVCKFEAVIRD
ncbi:MAG TPA: NADH-quinone oxidoreductase subunit NuoF [Victivallales bacterium]|nr:NADH-quinone oxidoreductase subunit NuoF [Victivallales bacterium]